VVNDDIDAQPHTDFQNSLRTWLSTPRSPKLAPPIVFTEIALAGSFGSEGRLDVVTFSSKREYTELKLRGFEVKVSRSDLLGDLRAQKWQKYLPYVHEFYFAFPDGLATVDEIPYPAGVLIKTAGGFKFVRKAQPLAAEGVDSSVVSRLLWRAHRESAALAERLRVAERRVHAVQAEVDDRIRRVEARYEQLTRAAAPDTVSDVGEE